MFHALQIIDTVYSLNDIIVKGRNNMNKLAEIVTRCCIHKVDFRTDTPKMWNTVKLHKENWCLQRYIWYHKLDPSNIPEKKEIKTLIYGVKSW